MADRDQMIRTAAAAIANARGARRGALPIRNILDVLQKAPNLRNLYDEVMDDAKAVIAALDLPVSGDDPKALAAAACLPSTDADAEIARLREALKPFATYAAASRVCDADLGIDGHPLLGDIDAVTIGDFRRARAALSEDTAR